VPEDSASIQLALAQVFNELAAVPLDPRRAGLILYGLQIASLHVQRNPIIFKDHLVQSVTHSPEGDELGPRLIVCDDIADCNDCSERYNCRSAVGVRPRNEKAEAENQPTGAAPDQQAAENKNGDASEIEKKDAA
jgi:hypothetical protein